MRTLLVASAVFFMSAPAFAGGEIVFRFTEEQAGEACKAKGKAAFETITSEDGKYTLMCLYPAGKDSEGRSPR